METPSSTLRFVHSQRLGVDQLVLDGHILHHNNTNDGAQGMTHYWRCGNYYQDIRCPFRAITRSGRLVKKSDSHRCVPQPEQVLVREVRHDIRTTAATTNRAPSSIVAAAVQGQPSSVLAALPRQQLLTKAVQNARKKGDSQPACPATASDIQLVAPYNELNGENFVLYDNNSSPRIIVFGTRGNLTRLASLSHWLADGTFKVAPPQFLQVWTVHGLTSSGLVLPLVFALLENKLSTTYLDVLTALSSLEPTLKPSSVVVDYEKAEIKAFKDAFPSIEIRGCHFHFSQAIFRQIQSFPDVFALYKDVDKPDNSRHLRTLAAIALVPCRYVGDAYKALAQADFWKDNEENLGDLLDYFEKTWLGRDTRRGYVGPQYEPTVWCQHAAILRGLPRTNNAVEGWHNAFIGRVACNRPNIWRFIEALKEEQSLIELNCTQMDAGGSMPPVRSKYRKANEALKRIVEEAEGKWGTFTDDEWYDYLLCVSTNISYN